LENVKWQTTGCYATFLGPVSIFPSNISARNYQNQLVCLEIISSFFETVSLFLVQGIL